MTDLYDDLGVDRDATDDDIKAAYRREVKETHPDVGGDREAFERVQHAYLVLKDPKRRAKYDETGEDDAEPDNARADILSLIGKAMREVLSGLAEDGRVLQQEEVTKHIRNWLFQHRDHLRKAIKEAEVEVAKLEELSGRFTQDGEGDGASILENTLAGMIRPFQASIANGNDEVRKHEEALAMIDGAGFRADPKPPAPVYGDIQGVTVAMLNEQMRRMREAGLFDRPPPPPPKGFRNMR